jgi:DNA mismatch endonuclease (patch repair protein)
MPDIFTKEKRSWVMSRIRSRDTKIEKFVEAHLKKNKIKFKKNFKIIGSPDFAIPNKEIAIFIDGDFWHGYDYKKRRHNLPEYWKEKIQKNMNRDKKVNKELKILGWKVIRIWEHQIEKKPEIVMKRLLGFVYKVASA